MITGEFVSYLRGRGSELYLIREYTPTIPRVTWTGKRQAKTGELKFREFSREDERRLRVVFDNPGPGRVTPAAYEKAVSMAATLACNFNGQNVERGNAGSGYKASEDLNDFLRYLALIHPARSEESVLDALPVSTDYNVILTARTPGTLPSALWESSYVIYMD